MLESLTEKKKKDNFSFFLLDLVSLQGMKIPPFCFLTLTEVIIYQFCFVLIISSS